MIRFGAIVSVVAVAMGLLIVGAVAGDLTLVYVSIALAGLALLMLIVGVAIWRDAIFGAASGSAARAAGSEPELVGTSARGGASAAKAESRATGTLGVRPAGGDSGGPAGGRGARPANGPGARGADRSDRGASAGQSVRRRGGAEDAAAPTERGGAHPSHRSAGRPERDGDTRGGPGPSPSADRDQRGRDQRDRDQRDRDQRDRDQRDGERHDGERRDRDQHDRNRDQHDRFQPERSHRDWARPAPVAGSPAPTAGGGRPPAGAMGTTAQIGPAGAASPLRDHSTHGQPGTTRPMPTEPAAVRPYAASAGGGVPSVADALSRRATAAAPAEPARPGRPDRAQSAPASPFFTPAGKGSPDADTQAPPSQVAQIPTSSTLISRSAARDLEAGSRQSTPTSPAVSGRVGARPEPATTSAASGSPAATSPAPPRIPLDGSTDVLAGGRASASAPSPSARAEVTVSVVPGIARYHTADCILIRFLSADDLETLPLPAAEKIGCVPCRACRPEKPGASG